MEVVLSERMFELVMARWAGFGDRPGEIFPSLNDVDGKELSDELDAAIRRTRLVRSQKVV